MSQLHTYESYIDYLVDQAKVQQLDNLANGILQTHFMVAGLQAELKAKDEAIGYLLEVSAPMTPQQEECWPVLKKALKGT